MTTDSQEQTFDVCMIVKNEEDNLKLTLPNIVESANKVIVVDTGSSDLTKETALSLGAEVYDFKWTGDFSAARNFSVSKAKAQWVLWLDADEFMDVPDILQLKNTISEAQENILFLKIHECDFGTKNSKRFYFRDKAFRNHMGIAFERPVSEQLFIPSGVKRISKQCDNINIWHWGLDLKPEKMRDKISSRIAMYKDCLDQNPSDLISCYMIGQKHFDANDTDNALIFFNKVIELASKTEPSHIPFIEASHIRRAWIFLNKRRYEEAIVEANIALSTNSSYIEPYCIISAGYIALKDIDSALKSGEKAVSIPKTAHQICGSNDFCWNVMRYAQYANCLALKKMYKESLEYFHKVLEAVPGDKNTLETVAAIEGLLKGSKASQ